MPINFNEVCSKLKDIARGSGCILMKYFETDQLNENTKLNQADIVTNADIESDAYIRKQFSTFFPEFGVITEEGKNIQPKNPGEDEFWLCADPLDGTTNFSCGVPYFSVSIALLDHNYKPVVGVIYDPTRDELFSGIKGQGSFLESPKGKKQLKCRTHDDLLKCLLVTGFSVTHLTSSDNNIREIQQLLPKIRCLRRFGGTCLDMCYVAAGRVDGYWERGPHIWDIAAGWIIATEAGCLVTDYNGNEFTRETLQEPLLTPLVASPKIHKLMLENIKIARADIKSD